MKTKILLFAAAMLAVTACHRYARVGAEVHTTSVEVEVGHGHHHHHR